MRKPKAEKKTRYLSSQGAVDYLRMRAETLRALRREGTFPWTQLGPRLIRYDIDLVDAAIRRLANRQVPDAETLNA
jgi:hypothetical protein